MSSESRTPPTRVARRESVHRKFAALHDYGQGGLWVIIRAESAAHIREKYPQLQVFEDRPPMLDDSTLAAIRGGGVQDIDEPPSGWLAELAPQSGDKWRMANAVRDVDSSGYAVVVPGLTDFTCWQQASAC